MTRYYLGLSTSGHDPALALVDDTGRVLFAEATERFLQDKRAWGALPDHPSSLREILGKWCAPDAEFVVATSWARTKDSHFTKIMDTLLPASEGAWLRKLQRSVHDDAGSTLARHVGLAELPDRRDFEHHLCHAAFAAYCAPTDDAVCLVLDGEGDVGAASAYRLAGGKLKRLWRSWGPGSLGAFYGWLTGACGFDWKAGEEWKVMGLAAFGEARPDLVATLTQMLSVEDGRILLADSATLEQAMAALRPYGRTSDADVMRAADLAASGQAAYSAMADAVLAACVGHGTEHLILSGGCALNSSYNGTILRRFGFTSVHVPPAPGDDGNAVGAALLAWMQDHPDRPLPQARGGASASPFLGTAPDSERDLAAVRKAGIGRITELGGNAPARLAEALAAGKIVGVMRGPAEFGPRALGHRSILADPRPAGMKDRLNRQVKGRESYRPFAPIVPLNRVSEWFEAGQPSPYMSFALSWRPAMRSQVPAVVHQDGTGRLQTVEADDNPWLHRVLDAFEARSGVPILLNTSFNVMGKPIVHSVQDAMAVLATTGLDAVLLDTALVEKAAA